MRMSASCPPADAGAGASAGFSLLEMLVVLVLVASMAALVTPRLQVTYRALVLSGERAETGRQLARLPLLARASGRPIQVAKDDARGLGQLLAFPEGWRVRPLEPVAVAASGVCSGARVQVEVGAQREVAWLSAPACELKDEE